MAFGQRGMSTPPERVLTCLVRICSLPDSVSVSGTGDSRRTRHGPIAITIAIAIRYFELTVHGTIERRGPQKAPGREWLRLPLDGFVIAIAIAIETRIAFGIRNIDGELGADRNVYPTKAGVPAPDRYQVSAGV